MYLYTIYIFTNIYIYIYVYIYICLHTPDVHKHINVVLYIYIYIGLYTLRIRSVANLAETILAHDTWPQETDSQSHHLVVASATLYTYVLVYIYETSNQSGFVLAFSSIYQICVNGLDLNRCRVPEHICELCFL